MNLSKHFTLHELTRSDTAIRLGIDNTPNAEELEKLTWLAARLEEVRAILGALHVNSGFRCLALNRALKSKDNSQHLQCEAADLSSAVGLSAIEMCQRVARSEIQYDQVIYEFESWMHISFAYDRTPRAQILTIDRLGTRAGLAAPTPRAA